MLKIYSLLILLFISGSQSAEDVTPKVYPIPPTTENSLFYIQRSKNTNAIVYDINRLPDGTPDPINPLHIYWIRYASDSTTEDLSYIQEKYAYGITSRPYNGMKNEFVMQFVSYSKKNFYLLPTSTPKKYAAYTNINGKLAELKKVFIKLNGGTFWFPTIEYIELTGKDPSTQQPISERFTPKR